MARFVLPSRVGPIAGLLVVGVLGGWPLDAFAQAGELAVDETLALPGVELTLNEEGGGLAPALRILMGLTVLSLAPALMIVMTSFTRIIVVLAILRHALGMQQTPPNPVLIGLALFLTMFSMAPILEQVNEEALQPFMAEEIAASEALDLGMAPMREFMIRQTEESTLEVMYEVAKRPPPTTIDEVSSLILIPAFLLSELKMAFQIGFVIFLPFVLIDIVVASLLMSMGMLMVPPMMLSLPVKIMMFVLIDGWALVVQSLMGSFG